MNAHAESTPEAWLYRRKTTPSSSCNPTFNFLLKRSPFYTHLVHRTRPTLDRISKDWVQSPQLRHATPQLFAGAVIMEGPQTLLLNCLLVYGRFKGSDSHFERRTETTTHTSSFPQQESKYGRVCVVAVDDENLTKLKIGLLTSNALVTSSLRLDRHAITTDEVVEISANTNINIF